MKINYILNEDNRIISYTSFPLDETLPIIEIENIDAIYMNVSQIINGNFIQNKEEWQHIQEEQKEQWNKKHEIETLKRQLLDTDYITLKYIEGKVTKEEFDEVSAQRQVWRDRINELEAK